MNKTMKNILLSTLFVLFGFAATASAQQAVNTELPTATATTDGASNPTVPGIRAYLYCYNGSTWDRCPGATTGVTTNTELPTAAALADNTSNPTVPGVASFMMCYDGSTWDRCVNSTDSTIGTAIVTTGPAGMVVYSDFDGSALPTLSNVDTEGEALPAAASIKGVQYVMIVNEDGSLERGTTTTPSITVQAASATSGASTLKYTSAGSTEDEHAVCTGPCNIYSITITNTNASARYMRCENDTAANTTPGSETVELDLAIPGATTGAGFTATFPLGAAFSTAATCWLVTGAADTDVAEVAANEIKVFYTFKQ